VQIEGIEVELHRIAEHLLRFGDSDDLRDAVGPDWYGILIMVGTMLVHGVPDRGGDSAVPVGCSEYTDGLGEGG
jgi:hypothetical protein